jgi:hypothetical protein
MGQLFRETHHPAAAADGFRKKALNPSYELIPDKASRPG